MGKCSRDSKQAFYHSLSKRRPQRIWARANGGGIGIFGHCFKAACQNDTVPHLFPGGKKALKTHPKTHPTHPDSPKPVLAIYLAWVSLTHPDSPKSCALWRKTYTYLGEFSRFVYYYRPELTKKINIYETKRLTQNGQNRVLGTSAELVSKLTQLTQTHKKRK